jgi:excisionase family DNA binding protein
MFIGSHDRLWLRVAAEAIRATARRDGLRPPSWVGDLELLASAGHSGTNGGDVQEVGESAGVPLAYRPEEAAEMLRVSTRTVNRLIDAGELLAIRVLKDRRIARDDLLDFVERRRREVEAR